MAYATQTDMEAHCSASDLIALTDRAEPPAGVVDTDTLSAALANASGLMDGYFAKRLAVPLVTPPADVTIHCVHIAYYLLHRDIAPEKVRKDYEDALRWLRDVATGLILVAGAPAPAANTEGAAFSAPARVFNRDTMGGF